MSTLSLKDRTRLAVALESNLPSIHDPHLQNLFLIMLVLLRDYKVLEAYTMDLMRIDKERYASSIH
ncbi:MAG: hypothetical protein LBV80_02915 [Deltaproteobacteria bacterium]|jgi:hypothetical protein|nr:hypothetical protein [Deltaproteobacteria bacterium]